MAFGCFWDIWTHSLLGCVVARLSEHERRFFLMPVYEKGSYPRSPGGDKNIPRADFLYLKELGNVSISLY